MGSSSTPRTPFPPSRRPRSGKFSIYDLLGSLTDRDIQICLDLHEHRVLTTDQIFELHFPSYHRARKRLLQLYERGVLGRFRPPRRPGSEPWHYVLDDLGAHVVAAYRGIEFKELKFRRDRVLRLARSPYLRHLRETNGFFCRLAYACGEHGSEHHLATWIGERNAQHKAYGLVRPDGVGELVGPNGSLVFYLELDRGTEDLARLEQKLSCYERLRHFPEEPHAILFCFHSEAREVNARRVLNGAGSYTVATTTSGLHMANPLGPIWLPRNSPLRYPLSELPRPERDLTPSWQVMFGPRDDL